MVFSVCEMKSFSADSNSDKFKRDITERNIKIIKRHHWQNMAQVKTGQNSGRR